MADDKNNKNEIIDPRDSWNVKKEQKEDEVPKQEPKRSKFSRWIENYWYHHKWKTIIISFFAIVFIICILQFSENEKVDIQILYAGPEVVSVPMSENIQMAYEAVMKKDNNGDGELNASLYSLFIMSSEQIKALYDAAEENSEAAYVNTEIISGNKSSFDMEIMAGDSVICMLDPWLYDYVRESGGFMELEEVLGYIPEGTDEYGTGIALSDTAFGQFFSGLSDLPDDTVLCVRRLTTFAQLKGKKKTEKMHEYALDVFREAMSFSN